MYNDVPLYKIIIYYTVIYYIKSYLLYVYNSNKNLCETPMHANGMK